MIRFWLLFGVVGLLSFTVYLKTLAPTITWLNNGSDSGDLATAVAVGGVPHPPGYPTYLILGEGFKLLPFGDVAYRLNLLSAACAALAVAVLGLVIYQTLLIGTKPQENLAWFCAASASLTLAFSGAFWSQAVIAEVYALHVLFATVLLYGTVQVQAANKRWLTPVLFSLLGLSLGNHPSILLLFPLFIGILKIRGGAGSDFGHADFNPPTRRLLSKIWGASVRWHWGRFISAGLAFWLGLSVYGFIPLRAAALPPLNWGVALSWPNFWWLVTAQLYHPFLFDLPWNFVPTRILAELHLLMQTFLWWGLPVGLLGWQKLVTHNRTLAYSSLLAFFLISVYAIGYNTTDSHVYLLPAFVIFSVWLGWGLYQVGRALPQLLGSKPYGRYWANGGIIFFPLLSLLLNFSDQDISQDREAYQYAQRSLQQVAADAIIITDDDRQTFALWYGRYGLFWRPDVSIVNVNLLPYAWYRQTLRQTHPYLRLSNEAGQPITTSAAFIESNISRSPIYLATLQQTELVLIRSELQTRSPG